MSSKLEPDVCYRVRVAPSGESYGGITAGPAESNGSVPPDRWLSHLQAACTRGLAPGPTLGNEYGRTLPLSVCLCICADEVLQLRSAVVGQSSTNSSVVDSRTMSKHKQDV